MFGRTKIAMLVAECFGVMAITLTVLSVSKSQLGFPYFIALGVGITLAVMALVVGNISGAHFNPAVTLGLWTVRKVPTLQAIAYIAAQLLGGILALKLFVYLIDQPLNSIANKKFDWRVLIAEAVGTYILVFGVTAAVYQGYKGARFAVTIGGALFLGALIASVASNGLINPAVALGVQSWSRAYVVGPLLGGVLAAATYGLLFAPVESLAGVATPVPVAASEVKSKSIAKKTTPKKAAKKPTTKRKTTTKK